MRMCVATRAGLRRIESPADRRVLKWPHRQIGCSICARLPQLRLLGLLDGQEARPYADLLMRLLESILGTSGRGLGMSEHFSKPGP